MYDLCDRYVIIYRFWPHGSKKLENLTYDRKDFNEQGYLPGSQVHRYSTMATVPMMIAHDQEPLNYNFYTEETCANALRQRWQLDTKKDKELTALQRSQKFIELYKKSHLRVATNVSYNLNDLVLLVHSEKNSIELNLYENNNFVGVYYWAHALIARDWYRFAYYDNELKENFDDINYDFLIYNRAWSGTREYRLKFVELLSNYNLVSNCNIKFSPVDNGKHYLTHEFQIGRAHV